MALRPRYATLIAVVVSAILGFYGLSSLLISRLRGIGPSGYPGGRWIQSILVDIDPGLARLGAGTVYVVGLVVLAFLVVFFFVRSAARAQQTDPARRSFLTGALSGAGAGVVALAAGATAAYSRVFFGHGNEGRGWGPVGTKIFQDRVVGIHPEWKEEWKESRIQDYRMMGRTGWRVSDISLGASRIRRGHEKLIRAALDRGVNYVDTAPDYSAEGSERAIGRALKGRREEVFLATKFCTPFGQLPAGTSVADYKASVEQSLRRLQTGYVDLVHIHGCDSLERLLDPNLHEAFAQLKQQGKARFLGFSSHTPNLVQVANAAIADGRFDVMMLAYHHGIWPQLAQVIEKAHRANVGVVAMKTLKGAKHRGLEDYRGLADSYSQAALRWVLKDPNVSSAIISFSQFQHVDEYLSASGGHPERGDLAALRRYDELTAGTFCAPHCGVCLDSCPEGLPINDILRQRMYFEDYGWEKEGVRLYSQLERTASVCVGCSAPCTGSCPLGLPIQERMIGADELLRLSS